MSFVVDASDWKFDGVDRQGLETCVEALLARIADSVARGEQVWIGDGLQSQPVLGELTLWQLSDPNEGIGFSPELWQELAAWLGSAPRYPDELEWPQGFEHQSISIDGAPPVENADVAWVLCWLLAGRPMGCIGLFRSGEFSVASGLGEFRVRWISSDNDQRQFWVDVIKRDGSADALRKHASSAYPSIRFSDGVWRGLMNLAGGYAPIADQIQRVLLVLDQSGKWIFSAPPPALAATDSGQQDSETRPTNHLIERRFTAHHIDATPENPNVYADRTCREVREINVDGRILYCGWHAKLEAHRNRIHFHPPVPEAGGKVIVGIIHEHLPTP